MLQIDSHPLLDICLIETNFEKPLGEANSPTSILQLMATGVSVPLATNDEVKKLVRDLLRVGGFKPTGRSKPASEYLLKSVEQGKLSSINPAVDILNVVSLHSGLPISVVDLDLVGEPLSVGIAEKGSSFVFNQSDQTIDISGLLNLFDNNGPCANAVKDSQRTKTSPGTTRTLSVIWGTNELPGRTDSTFDWYRQLLVDFGAVVNRVSVN